MADGRADNHPEEIGQAGGTAGIHGMTLCKTEKFSDSLPAGKMSCLIPAKPRCTIILFGGAENMLKRYGIKTASLDMEKMQAEYDAMTVQKAKLKKTYQTAEKEAVEADKQLKNIRQYLGIERDKQEEIKHHKKRDMSL